jgi:hypothetical protein
MLPILSAVFERLSFLSPLMILSMLPRNAHDLKDCLAKERMEGQLGRAGCQSL